MRGTVLDLERFHSLIDKGYRNTMIWSPRQSGKTYALVMKFLQYRNSVFLTVNNGMQRHVQQMCYDLGAPDRRRDVYRIQQATHSTHGRMVDAIFIDEIDWISPQQIDEAMMCVYPTLVARPTPGRLIAISTPSGVRSDNFYQRYFQDEFTINSEGVTDWRVESIPSIIINVNDHFGENEQEYFRI